MKSVMLDKAMCKRLANDPAFTSRFAEFQGRVMSLDNYKSTHTGTDCSECAWGTAMSSTIQNEVINNQSFRSKFLLALQAQSIRILKNGRMHTFGA